MALLDPAFAFLYQLGDAFAFLVLAACGLAVVIGMMGVINLAHGEFIMCGAYVTVATTRAGLPLPLAILVGSLVAGAVGMVLERLVIRHLYGAPPRHDRGHLGRQPGGDARHADPARFQPARTGTPLGSFTVGSYSYSTYRVVLMLAALAVLAGLYLAFNATASARWRGRRSRCRTWPRRSASTLARSTR